MRNFKRMLGLCLVLAVLLGCVAPVSAAASLHDGMFAYEISPDGSHAVITAYLGSDETLIVPRILGGLPVGEIGANAFLNARFRSVILPDSLTSIGYGAFMNDTALTSVFFPRSLKTVETNAFYNCASLAGIDLPDSVSRIGSYAFAETAWIRDHADGLVYLNNILYCYKGAMSEGYSLLPEEGTVLIADSAFFHQTTLHAVILPDSVKTVGSLAFAYCTNLSEARVFGRDTVLAGESFAGDTSLTLFAREHSFAKKFAADNAISFHPIPTARPLGDVNNDGHLHSDDCRPILLYCAGCYEAVSFSEEDAIAADYDQDLQITTEDARGLLLAVTGS